jgi:Na+-translocating ferredoxin:NAD+ oxidoreductase RnfG subunit
MKLLIAIALFLIAFVATYFTGYINSKHKTEIKIAKQEIKTEKEIKKNVAKINASSDTELDNRLRELGCVKRK